MIKKLKRTKFQSEMNDVEDSELSRLHEGVRNAFASIWLSTVGDAACSNEVNDSIVVAGVNIEEDVDKALEAEMAAESSLTQGEQMAAMLEATESMQFRGNNDEDDGDGDDDVTDRLSGTLVTDGVPKYGLNNIYVAGWKKIKDMDIKSVRKRSNARRVMKRRVAKYVLKKVQELKTKLGEDILNDLLEDEINCNYEEAWWTDNIQSMCQTRYWE